MDVFTVATDIEQGPGQPLAGLGATAPLGRVVERGENRLARAGAFLGGASQPVSPSMIRSGRPPTLLATVGTPAISDSTAPPTFSECEG